jgi:hemolysin activation/secretion protein
VIGDIRSKPIWLGRALVCLCGSAIGLWWTPVEAQLITPPQRPPEQILERPGGTEPLAPPAATKPPAPTFRLPPVAPPPPKDKDRLSTAPSVYVRRITIVGNTVFPEDDLAALVAPYENRVISSTELQELRHTLTLLYVNNGYINSGVIIPDQQVIDGVITLQVIEGQLSEIEVTGNQRLRTPYIEKRLALGAHVPLNIYALQERVQLLHQDPLLERITAELGPGIQQGEAVLRAQVEEASPYRLWLEANNYRAPSVGGEQLVIRGAYTNLTGWGDALSGEFNLTEGLRDFIVDYAFPITARDTTLRLYYERTSADVQENPFKDLNIDSDTTTLAVRLSHPLIMTPTRELNLGISLDHRKNKTYLLEQRFSFWPGAQNGKTTAAVLRLSQEWLERSQRQVIAARSTLNFGLDIFGATDNESGLDSQFFYWLGQFQWARRLGILDSQVIFRTDVQFTNNGLPPFEQFAVGGAFTVRGYRENQMVRDKGWVTSLEFRIPLLQRFMGEGSLQLAPFVDIGHAWNTTTPTLPPDTIYSVGMGLRWDPTPKLHAQVYWGKALQNVDVMEKDLQDHGIHFQLSYQVF